LKLSFAKTIDTFQGQNAGPVDPGKPVNAIQRIICDPGTHCFEARKPGIFFTMISQATTIGEEVNNKCIGSAVYFYDFGFGTTMTPSRISHLRISPKTNKVYTAIERREKWIAHLQSNLKAEPLEEMEINEIFTWAKNTKISKDDLSKLVHKTTSWRTQIR
jgi:hypothetical protein